MASEQDLMERCVAALRDLLKPSAACLRGITEGDARMVVRAVIQVMREPTDDQIRAGVSKVNDLEYSLIESNPHFDLELRLGTYAPEAKVCWQAMIDAALFETPKDQSHG